MKTMDVTEYFNEPPELMPYIPELLADLWALGSSPETVVDWLRSLELPPETTRVLDVGCGKGAVSIPLAKELKFHILGIDFFEAFVLEAKEKTKELGVESLCSFECSDMHDVLKKASNFGIVIYTGVGGVLGSSDQCVFRLRQAISSGGYIVIDDGFRLTSHEINFPGYDHYVSYEETIRQLTSQGDILLREKIFPSEDVKRENQKQIELISKRAEVLAKKHPELIDSIHNFLDREKQECEILERDVAWAMWLLQKA